MFVTTYAGYAMEYVISSEGTDRRTVSGQIEAIVIGATNRELSVLGSRP